LAAVPSPKGRPSFAGGPARAPQAAVTASLYERHSAKILSYCLHQLGSREEAEDAVQTTFMNAFRALGRGVVPEAESAWLFKIAENVCLSRRRSSWRRGRIESPSDFEVIEEMVPGPSRQRDELIGIEDALASMPEQQRRAILLREWQGLSYREISEELELSQSAVETLIFRARRSLAQGLEQPDLIKTPKRKGFRRALHVTDLGTLAAAAKTSLAGGVAAKATVAAVAVTTAAATAAGVTPKLEGHSPQPAAPASAVQPPAAKQAAPSAPSSAAAFLDASASTPALGASRRQQERAAVGQVRRRPLLSAGASAPTTLAAAPAAPAALPVPTAGEPGGHAVWPVAAVPDQPAAGAPGSAPAPVAPHGPAAEPLDPIRAAANEDEAKTKLPRHGGGGGISHGEEPVLGSSPPTVGLPPHAGPEPVDEDLQAPSHEVGVGPAPEPAPAPAPAPSAPLHETADTQPAAPGVQQPAVPAPLPSH
jgi:RNA polymerase sigma factor (sigma-70 family)